MTNANPLTTEELSSVEGMNNTKLKRIVELIIQLDNERLKEEAEESKK